MWKTITLLIITLLIIPFVTFYWDTPFDPLKKKILADLLIVYLVAGLLCFLISSLSNNFSQVDKLWSIMPAVYSWIVVYASEFEPRIVLMAVIVSIWGIRLSYNFYRRGGYSWRFWEGEEDYRWAILRAKKEFQPSWKWVLFNFSFISMYQMGLILLFTLPILRSVDGREIGLADFILAAAIIFAIVIETIADQQQWNFQNEKLKFRHTENQAPDHVRKGFLNSGLWSLVRHPNYAAEQLIWILFYGFSVIASGQFLNASVAGCLLLIILFQGSADFSESVSASKYPGYNKYIDSTPRFVPFSKFKKKRNDG